jgi:hypothetical protein
VPRPIFVVRIAPNESPGRWSRMTFSAPTGVWCPELQRWRPRRSWTAANGASCRTECGK